LFDWQPGFVEPPSLKFALVSETPEYELLPSYAMVVAPATELVQEADAVKVMLPANAGTAAQLAITIKATTSFSFTCPPDRQPITGNWRLSYVHLQVHSATSLNP
jgi:hypothetical protein